jgi:Lar family restriction alleviation protein
VSEKLLDCPFCEIGTLHLSSNGSETHFVECDRCGASGPTSESETAAIRQWNARTPQSPQAGRVDEEMVERAAKAYWGNQWEGLSPGAKSLALFLQHEALTAALHKEG